MQLYESSQDYLERILILQEEKGIKEVHFLGGVLQHIGNDEFDQ